MACHQPCGCDEARELRAEVERLRSVVAKMKGGLQVLLQEATLQPQPTPRGRCSAVGNVNMAAGRCELPEGHGGFHRWCQIGWP